MRWRRPGDGQRHDLVAIVPLGPTARREAERTLDRVLHEIAEKRNPRTSATVDQLLTPSGSEPFST